MAVAEHRLGRGHGSLGGRRPPRRREDGLIITFIAHLRVSRANAPAFEDLMAHVAAMTHKHEPGVVYYECSKSVDDPDTYVVVEVYRDVEVHAAHMASDWVRESLPVSARLIEGLPHIRQYVSSGSEPVRHRLFPGGRPENQGRRDPCPRRPQNGDHRNPSKRG